MQVNIVNFSKQVVGTKELLEDIFAIAPRWDIVKLVVDWQLAKKRAGTHATKTISEVSGTTKKPFKQKGTGQARQGSLRSVHMRGGGVIHGPVIRDHATKLQKKVRVLGLKSVLSAKHSANKLFILDSLAINNISTKNFITTLNEFAPGSCFIVDSVLNDNLLRSVRNTPYINAVPQIGLNVIDIMKHDNLLISTNGIDMLQARLKS